jgi:hypothetical protein
VEADVTREEFFALPPGIALRVLFDALDEETAAAIASTPAIDAPRSPKYDYMIYRQGGVQWASETDLRGLVWWRDRAQASAAEGGKWAEKDAKNAEALNRWIAYREFYPDAPWSGERNREAVVAPAPTAKPRVHPRAGGGAPRPAPKQQEVPPDDYFGTGGGKGYSDADYGSNGVDDDIPF